MSREIDERVVSMKFDNQDFEKNAAVSMSTLDTLKKKLNFSDVQDGLSTIDTSSLRKAFAGVGDIDTGKFNSVMDDIEYRMSNLGIFTGRLVENIADSIFEIVEKALSGIGKIVTYAEQGIVTGGYNRASNIQTSKFRLEGLGIAWDDIYGDIDYAVTNTAYALDQAALVASQLATSGIRPGERYVTAGGEERDIDTMAMILRSISASAAMSGGSASYDQIGRYFTNMLSRGKVYATELNELSGATGLNVRQVVADYMAKTGYSGKNDWTVEDITQLTQDSKFNDPMIIIEALYETYGEQAVKANETLTGVMANTKSALARIGEDFFTPIIENSGPLVQLFEGLRQSLNDLRKAIQPVTIWLGNNVAGILEKIGGTFMEKQYQVDEEGNVQRDENGEAIYKWGLKEKGGLFSSWLQPWTDDKEFVPFSDDVLAKIPDEVKNSSDFIGGTFEDAESRASRLLKNISETLMNVGSTIKSFFEIVGDSFDYVFPNFKGIEDVIVKISEKIKDVTASWKEFMQSEKWENSNLHKIITGIFSGIDIIIRFGKSFKDHILDPIFGKGAEVVKSSGLGDIIGDLFQKITDFDNMLKQEGNEDYFGKFFEKAKTVIVKIKDTFVEAFNTIKQTFGDLKDIIFNTDLTWSDKWDAIKAYFTDNFELPGWAKIKDIFSGISDAIDTVTKKIKKFFGIEDEEETSGRTSGFATGGRASGYPGRGPDISNYIDWEKLNKDSEKANTFADSLSTVGEKLKGAFSKIQESFDGFDLDGFQGILLAILAIIILVVGGTIYLIAKLINAFTNFTVRIPKLLGDLLEGVNGVLTKFSSLLGASAFEKKTEGIKNIIEAIGMMTLIIFAVAGLTYVMKKVGDEEAMIESLETAGIIVGALTVVISGLSIALVALTKGSAGLGIVLDAANKSFTANLGGNPLDGISRLLKSLVISIGGLMAIIALASIDGDWFKEGLARVGILFGLLVVFIGAIIVSTNILSKTQAKFTGVVKLNGVAATITAIAGLITSVAIATLLLIPAIALLSIDGGWFKQGLIRLALIGAYIAALSSVMLVMATAIGKWGKLKGGSLAASLFGVVGIILSTGGAILMLAGAMKLISTVTNDMSGAEYAKMIGALAAAAVVLTAVPAILGTIMTKNKSKNFKPLSLKELLSITTSILAVGAATLAIGIGLKLVAEENLANIWSALGAIGIIYAEMIVLFGVLGNMNVSDMESVSGTMIKMSLSVLGVSAALLLLTKFTTVSDLLASSIIVSAVMAVMMAMVIGASALIKRAGNLDANTMLTLAQSMAYMALGTVPFIAAAVLVAKAMTDWNVDIGTMGQVFVGMVAITAGLSLLANEIAKHSKNVEKINISYLTNSAVILTSTLPFMALTLLFAKAADMLNLEPKWVLLSIVAVAGVVSAISFGIKMISESAKNMGKIKTSDLLKNSIVMLIDIIGPIAAFAGALYLLKNISVTQLIASAGSLTFMLAAVSAITIGMIQYSRSLKGGKDFPNLVKKVKLVFGSIATMVGSTLIFAGAIRLMGSMSWESVATSLTTLTALTAVAVVASILLIKYSKKIRGGEKTLPEVAKKLKMVLASYIVVAASMLVFAGALRMVSGINSSEMWRSFGILSLMATITTGLSAILVLLTKINYSGYGRLGLVIAMYATVTVSFIAFAAALNMLNKSTSSSSLWVSMGVLSIMAGVVTGMTAILSLLAIIKFDPKNLLTVIAGYASVSLGFAVFALALNKLRGIQFNEIKDALLALLSVTALVGLVAALLTILSGDAVKAQATGSILLGIGISMAGAGIFLLAASEGFKIFTEALMNLSGNGDKIVGGFEALNTGLLGGLQDFADKLPAILKVISSIITTTFDHINEVLPTRFDEIRIFIRESLIGIGNLVNDTDIQNAFAGIITGILDFLIKNVESWTEKIVTLAAKIVSGFWKAIFGTPLPDTLPDFLNEIGEKISELMGGKISTAIDIVVDANYQIDMANRLDEWRSQISEALHRYWNESGRSDETFDMFINSKQGQDMIELGVSYAIDPEIKKWANENFSGIEGLLMFELRKFFETETGSMAQVLDGTANSQIDEARRRVSGGRINNELPNGMTTSSLSGNYVNLTTAQLKEMMERTFLENGWNKEEVENLTDDVMSSDAWETLMEMKGNGTFSIDKKEFGEVLGLIDEVYDKLEDPEEKATFMAFWQQAIEESFGYNIYESFKENKDRIEQSESIKLYYEFLAKSGYGKEDYVAKLKKDFENALEGLDGVLDKDGKLLLGKSTQYGGAIGDSIYKYPASVVSQIPQSIRESGQLAASAYNDNFAPLIDAIQKYHGKSDAELWDMYYDDIGFYGELSAMLSAKNAEIGLQAADGASKTAATVGKHYASSLPLGFDTTLTTAGQLVSQKTVGLFSSASETSKDPVKKQAEDTTMNFYASMYPGAGALPMVNGAGMAIATGAIGAIQRGIGASPFSSLGLNVTVGFLKGMTDPQAEERMTRTAWVLKNKILEKIKNVFGIHSPAKVMYEPGEMITAGLGEGELSGAHYATDAQSVVAKMVKDKAITDYSDAGKAGGDAYASGFADGTSGIGDVITNDINPALESYSSNIDVTGIAGTIKNNLLKRMPSWDSIKSNFGIEKGISGNIEGVKNAWAQLKSAFTDDEGNFDLNGILGDTLDKLKAGLGGMVPDMSMNMEDYGINLEANSVLSDGWENEFSSWMASGLDTSENIDLKVVVDDEEAMRELQSLNDQMSTTNTLAANIPVTGGYSQSTLGNNTYVNNYNYNQTNNSPTALSTREINRQAELMLMRSRNNRWNNGY